MIAILIISFALLMLSVRYFHKACENQFTCDILVLDNLLQLDYELSVLRHLSVARRLLVEIYDGKPRMRLHASTRVCMTNELTELSEKLDGEVKKSLLRTIKLIENEY